MRSTQSDTPSRCAPAGTGRSDRIALAIVLLVHIGAASILLPPWEALGENPIRYGDHPVHTHRVYMYREALAESVLPWGYDPAISAGKVVTPASDVGAKPQQILGLLLFFLSPGSVERLFIFLVALTFPLWILLACRELGVPMGARAWVLVTLIGPAWLFNEQPFEFAKFFRVGLVAFLAASYFAPFVLVRFLKFVAEPGPRSYAAFCLCAILLQLLHLLGAVPLLLALVALTLFARPLPWRWRMAAILAPLVVLIANAFWLPFVPLALAAPPPPWWPASIEFASLTYATWSDMLQYMAPSVPNLAALCGLGLTVYGLVVLKRLAGLRAMMAFLLAIAFPLFLSIFGSFVPVIVEMQPARFTVPAFALATLPIGLALFTLANAVRLPAGYCAAGVAVIVATVARLGDDPLPLELPPTPDPLAEFAARHTAPHDRLLVQSLDLEAQILPLVLGREVIGTTAPFRYDPAQFRKSKLWDRSIDSWTAGELRSALDRWGVAWVFTQTEEARTLLVELTGGPGEPVGKYHGFQLPDSPTRFLVGDGHVHAKVNRLELTELRPEDGLVVLRYRYHPAWRTTSGLPVYQHPIPEDPTGFIALRNPPDAITLRLSPWAMLRSPWPH